MHFTNDQHLLWAALVKRQLPNVERFACELYLTGLRSLALRSDKIPNLKELNQNITAQTGWRAMRTRVRYIDSIPWYQHFARREFVVTNFLRSWQEFEFTHEPDMFHDIFGHLPFHTQKEYTELIELFAPAFLRANKKEQDDIKRLAWFSYEFGLIKENGQNKIFGTGLLSSVGEIAQVMSGRTPILPYTIGNVLQRNKAIYTFNKELFVFDSLDSLKAELKSYFATIKGPANTISGNSQLIIDQQMTGII